MIELFKNMQSIHHTFKVTEDVYNAFQLCSGDFNPLHTDERFAKSKGFNERVMYGNILNAFVSKLIGECLPTQNVLINSQDISYRQPVFMNDILDAEVSVEEVFESVNVVNLKFYFKNESRKTVARGHVQISVI
ncbi:MaoC/PaaZ C-terminal domain-containing protein [Bacteroides difficilis]|uniref:MaoC/PaaZ C-terminal domain-containing protein n=1 Tax=Bacteroides difficilis TaxID=2763021 RepID=UPI003AB0992E